MKKKQRALNSIHISTTQSAATQHSNTQQNMFDKNIEKQCSCSNRHWNAQNSLTNYIAHVDIEIKTNDKCATANNAPLIEQIHERETACVDKTQTDRKKIQPKFRQRKVQQLNFSTLEQILHESETACNDKRQSARKKNVELM